MDELARLKTRTDYSKREAARLARLLKSLKDQAGTPLFDRHRVVRTPRERELSGLKVVDVWLHQRRLCLMSDRSCVEWIRTGEKTSDARLRVGSGLLLNDDFFLRGDIWKKMESQFDRRTYVRIFTDTVSFDELCLLRDALVSRGSMYNWIVNEGEVIHFVEGYDGHVQ